MIPNMIASLMPSTISQPFLALVGLIQEAAEGVVVEIPAGPNVPSVELMDGGIMMIPILACAILVVGMSAWTATRLWGARVDVGPKTRAGVDSVLFWGAFSVVLGVLGTLLGVMVAAQSIEMAGEIHATLVWGGIKVALITTVTGVMTLSVASVLWFTLKLRYRKLIMAAAASA